MTILTNHPWLLLLYLGVVLLEALVTLFPRMRWLGLVQVFYHMGVVLLWFYLGAALEDVLLFLLFSLAIGLGMALFVPQHKQKDTERKEDRA